LVGKAQADNTTRTAVSAILDPTSGNGEKQAGRCESGKHNDTICEFLTEKGGSTGALLCL